MRAIGELKVYHDYTCNECGATSQGTRTIVEIDDYVANSSLSIALGHPPAHAMPYGWASFYPGLFKCPSCLSKGV